MRLGRQRHHRIDGARVDDLAGLAVVHPVLGGGLDAEERPLEVHAEDPVPFLFRHVLDGAPRQNPGVVHHDVEGAVGLDGGVDESLHVALLGDVGDDGHGLPAHLGDDFGGLLEAVGVHVDEDELGSLLGEALGHAPAYAAAGSGHDRDLVLQFHGASLLRN